MSDRLNYSADRTGRAYGQGGSLRTDQMSSMQRGDAINREVGDQKRETAFERRLMRQLGRASRKGDIDAGFAGLDLTRRAQKEGRDVQGGIGSSEENRSVAAQSLLDRNDLTNQQDAATNGTPEQATPRASIRPTGQSGPTPSPMATSGTSTLDGGATPMPYDEEPPSPTSEPSGGQVSALDRELLQYGARVNADLRKSPGFGSRPGYGLVSSRKEGTTPIGGTVPNAQGGMTLTNMPPGQSGSSRPAPAATVAQGPASGSAPSTYVPVMGPPSALRQGGSRDTSQSPSPATAVASPPDPSRPAIAPSTPYKPPADVLTKRAADDLKYETRSASMAEQRQRDLNEGAARNAELKASRLTENWQGERMNPEKGFNMGSTSEMVKTRRGGMREKTTDNPTSNLTYAEKDKDGNQYRPKGWTQEDEEASARASETGSRLE
jgi:hypothetical protein